MDFAKYILYNKKNSNNCNTNIWVTDERQSSGERLDIEVDDFYEKVGTTLKHNYQECEVWLISSDISNIKHIGLKQNKKIKVFNGELECSFRNFNVYEGSKKTKNNSSS